MVQIAERDESRVGSVLGPLYLLLFPIPSVCFLAVPVTDSAYAASESLMWLHFSEWVIAAGLGLASLALIVLLIEFFARRVIRATAIGWAHFALVIAALIIELFNAFVHSVDGWTAVVPTGMTLSVIGAALMLAAAGTLLAMPVAWVVHRRAWR